MRSAMFMVLVRYYSSCDSTENMGLGIADPIIVGDGLCPEIEQQLNAFLIGGEDRPIVYSYMSSSKFLLDEHYVPKPIDFSNAECIPEGETHIKDTQPRGLFGYVAPEHIVRGVVNEKCDVYGFGALLLELLTRQRLHYLVHNINETKGESSSELKVKSTWWNFLNKIIEDDRFIEFVDPIIVGDGLCPKTLQQMKVFAKLAVKCISITPKDRPTMIDVAKQLKQLHRST
ncbi:hypothetical protein EZV62_006751 [Acer yangbiense]|uniref:Protein kinase domain-containing protein n=1 Tax=Acer yangbiense TaxID=1000413 RepID=A0A5C7IAQ6_9ROSI|nr:hypothetical protein EZV62_006751 [Acer yangbiense]